MSELPPPRPGRTLSYYFKATDPESEQTQILGPYPSREYAYAVRETMRSKGFSVGQIGSG